MGVGVVAMTPQELAAWVARSCEAQGVAVQVSDPATIAAVVVLLRGGAAGRSRAQRGSTGGPPGSQPPKGPYPVGVEAAAGNLGLVDDGVVQDGLDDGGLPGEVEGGPLGA